MSGIIKLGVGTEKPFKIDIATKILANEFNTEEIKVSSYKTESGVAETPTSLEETVRGACNRAELVLNNSPQTHFGVGLEGGVYFDGNSFYLIEAAAISIKMGEGFCYTESGVSEAVELPQEMIPNIKNGVPLSAVTLEYLKSIHIEVTIDDIQKNGTAFYLTQEQITRDSMMTQALNSAVMKLDRGLEARKP